MIPLETAVIGLIASNGALAGLVFHLTKKTTRRPASPANRAGRSTEPAAGTEPSGGQQ